MTPLDSHNSLKPPPPPHTHTHTTPQRSLPAHHYLAKFTLYTNVGKNILAACWVIVIIVPVYQVQLYILLPLEPVRFLSSDIHDIFVKTL
jgi:hypothetical protein